ncbi:MAG: hypothetical protein ACYC0F_11375 [Rhodanobacter sp.]
MNKTLCTLLLACGTIATANATESPAAHFGHGPNPMVYPNDSRPFGKSLQAWAEDSVAWIYAQPADHNPFPDPTGADCGVGQQGPVWFLAPIASMAAGDFVRSCTIPRGKAVLLMIGFASDPWPCPDPGFHPAPGQSLYDFLTADAQVIADGSLDFSRLDVTLDGRPVHGALDYRHVSDNLYSLKGDPSLQAVFDPCITGNWQPAVVNGYFMMFRPLSRGTHTIVRRSVGRDTGGVNTFTYYLTVR